MAKLLFIDDDPEVLAGLERAFRPWRKKHDCCFVCGGVAGARKIKCTPFDVAVTDMAMAIVSGNELIEQARQHRPRMDFIVFSGRCDQPLIENLTHRGIVYIAKPASPEFLMMLIQDTLDWQNVNRSKLDFLDAVKAT